MQKGIENFFSKRQREPEANSSGANPEKKQKTETPPEPEKASPSPPAERADPEGPAAGDLEERVKNLPEQVRQLCSLELSTIHPSWLTVLLPELQKPYFLELKRRLQGEKDKGAKVYPPEEDIYSWTRFCPLDQVKAVILGQDPYHGAGQAHGLAFSVKKGVRPPPSLLNMYKELESDIPSFKRPKHGNLEGWSRQGVLLLNATLTVRAAEPNSHKDYGWMTFTDAVINELNKHGKHIVFILWGSFAQKKVKGINLSKHRVLTSPHPSPLSATGFFGCKHFSKTNAFLESHNIPPIDWSDLP